MKQGRIEQISVADEIYGAPVSRFVAEFMGEVNLFDVTVAADGSVSSDVLSSRSGVKLKPAGQGARGLLMVRPEYVGFADSADAFDFTLSGPLHGNTRLDRASSTKSRPRPAWSRSKSFARTGAACPRAKR